MRRGTRAKRAVHWLTTADSHQGTAFTAIVAGAPLAFMLADSPAADTLAGTPPSLGAFTIMAIKGFATWRNLAGGAALTTLGIVVRDVNASGTASALDIGEEAVFGGGVGGLNRSWMWRDQRRVQSEVPTLAALVGAIQCDRPTVRIDVMVKRKVHPGQSLFLVAESDSPGLLGLNLNLRTLISRVS